MLSACAGFLALAAVHFTADYTGAVLALSPLNIGTAGLLGIPGVILLLVLNLVV